MEATHTLTTAQMADMEAMQEQGFGPFLVRLYEHLGIDLSDPDCPNIRPGDYILPYDQASTLFNLCCNMPGDGITKANHAMDWVNVGPSSAPEPASTQ